LTGYNTDGEGLVRFLEARGVGLRDRRAVILGGGGTGRAVSSALLDRGARGVTILNRTLSRAITAVRALEGRFSHADLDAGPLTPSAFAEVARGADIVVNCTAGGAAPTIASLDPSVVSRDGVWVDVNYWMADPPLRARCAELGLRFETGLGMLVHQGALAFELFTGHPVEAEVLQGIIELEVPAPAGGPR
ncbi:MAG: hypothetical protein D6798_12595, partial [Deltaproteobacteria bacterium]